MSDKFIFTGFMLFVVLAMIIVSLGAVDSEKQETQRMTVCVQAGGEWVQQSGRGDFECRRK